jgi:hypothetical protein
MGLSPGNAWWHIDGAPSATEWSAFFAGGTFVVALLAAVFALAQLHGFFNAQWDQARPYIVVDFSFRSSLMQVEIRNIAQSAAAEVQLTISPPFRSTRSEDADTLNRVFSSAWQLDLLAPGRRILHTLDSAFLYVEHPEFPQVYEVHATYRDANARSRWRWRGGWLRKTTVRYDEVFRLSFAQWSEAASELDHGTNHSRSLAEIAKAVQKISAADQFRTNIRTVIPKPKNEGIGDWLIRTLRR